MQVSACDTQFTGPEVGGELAVDSTSEMVAGQDATLFGQGLDQISEVTIDGVAVSFETHSAREATVAVPDGAGADGCLVEINLNHGPVEYVGAIRVADALQLEVGESKILNAADLRCVQLSSAAQEYVLSIASLTDEALMDRVLTLRSSGAPATEPADVSANRIAADAPFSLSEAAADSDGLEAAAAQAEFGEPFDDYANAQEGDVLTFVDWTDYVGVHEATTKDEVPTYEAEVVAIEGDQMFLVDLRYDTDTVEAVRASAPNLREAAGLANQHTVEAIRQVMDRDYVPTTDGAGGRILTIFTPDHGHGLATVRAQDLYPQLDWTSGLSVIVSDAVAARSGSTGLAGLLTHELAHLADSQNLRDGAASATGWYNEAVAVSAEERFYRLHGGVERQAGWDGAGAPSIARTPTYAHSDTPLWTMVDHHPTAAMYDRGARILLYAQGVAGDEPFAAAGPRLHERLLARAVDRSGNQSDGRSVWSLEVIAEEIGMSPTELLRDSWVADLTDDRVPDAAVARFNLPQIDRWDQSKLGDSPFLDQIEPGQSVREEVTVAGGNYAYWYIPRGSQDVSLEADGADLQPHHEVRLIRLR